jgi:hypothetical protein
MELLLVLLVAAVAAFWVGFKLLVGLVLLPFKLLALVVKGVGSVIGLLFGVVGLVATVVLLPLLPLVLLGGIVWLIVRAARPRPLPGEVRIVRA